MAVTTTNLGVITAYGDAVAAGYTGTKAEWQALMASYATVAEEANDAKDDAVAAKNTAVAKATEATTAAATANTAKDTATSKATEATTAANTATTKANEASASAQSIAQSAAQIQENTDDIDQLKSDFTDMQSDGVVPSAEQILSDKGVTDSVPYHYRKTGGDGADRLYDQIVGGTVCFNQLVQNGNFETTNGWVDYGTTISVADNVLTAYSANGASYGGFATRRTSLNTILGHKYFVSVTAKASVENFSVYKPYFNTAILEANDNITTIGTSWKTLATIANAIADSNNSMLGVRRAGSTYGSEYYIYGKNAMQIDLTAMFGTTIADYIYSLETAHAGDGVAFFKALFPNDYYPYNAGELVSVSGLSEHKMVGFNQFNKDDPTIVNGKVIDDNGVPTDAPNYFYSEYIPVLPNTEYYIGNFMNTSAMHCGGYYDENKNFISAIRINSESRIKTTPSNCHYIIVCAKLVDKEKVCINLSDSAKNGTYEPYKAHSYPLDSTLTLRGIPKLVDGKMCFDGDTYDADGTVTRKYGIVDLGTLNWKLQNENIYTASLINAKNVTNLPTITNAPYTFIRESVTSYNMIYKVVAGGYDALNLYFRNNDVASVSDFVATVNNKYFVYELATPTTEEADPYQHIQQCGPNGTEEYVSTGIVPIGHNSFYPENLRAKVEQLPWNFANLIAPTEATFTATRNYTTGSLFIVNNVLYKATSNIANGGTITPNTNCTATTLAEIISALA